MMRHHKADKTFDPMVNGMRQPAADRPPMRPSRGAGASKPARVDAATLRGPYRDTMSGERTIVETAAALGTFVSLGRAIRAAGLVDLLSGRGPFTVFAPTDDAFARVAPAELAALLGDKARLVRVLSEHIVRDTVAAPRAGSPRTAIALGGGKLVITVADRGELGRGFEVNGARIVKTEIAASNGVIHAIDALLMSA